MQDKKEGISLFFYVDNIYLDFIFIIFYGKP